jgi:Transcriptional Coactivator p15 (PC4)
MTGKRSPKESPKDAGTSKGLLPETYQNNGATEMQYHVQKRNAKTELANRRGGVGEVILSDSIDRLIWTQRHRNDLLCFSQSKFSGRTYLELRRFIQKEGQWIPTAKGCTIPPESFQAFLEAINAFAAGNRPSPANDSENGLESA